MTRDLEDILREMIIEAHEECDDIDYDGVADYLGNVESDILREIEDILDSQIDEELACYTDYD